MDLLSTFLGSQARARLLAHFVVHPDRREHVRALERHTGLGKRSLQAELQRLETMGLVRREREGGRVLYARGSSHPQWRSLDALVAAYGPTLVLRDALRGVPGLEAAFVFGSTARGDARPDSDIDVLLYGDEIADAELGAALLDAALVLDRRIDAHGYDAERFRRDNRPGASFLPAALAGPKEWLVGSPDALPRDRAKVFA
jgi:predicted nucleotidyltransferase